MKDAYDVIVIGSGVGGLTAGALLANRGFSVAVFEAQPVPGGYCTSFRRRGFTFDSVLDAISGCGEGGWLNRVLRHLGVEDEVGFVRLDPLRVDVFGDEKVVIPGTMPELMDLLYGIAPREKEGILGLLETMEEIYRTAMVTPPETLYTDPRLDRRGGALGRYRRATYKALLDDFVGDGKVRAVMSDRCAFMGLPPSSVSALAMTTMFMTYAVGGGYRIKDGADKLVKALVSGLKKAGGELHLVSPVTGIIKSDGRAAGVKLGRRTKRAVSAKAVVSAIDCASAAGFSDLKMGEGLRPSNSFFLVYLCLNRVLDLPDSMGYYPGYDIEGTFSDIATDIASPRASMEIINYSRISPGMAREGGTTLTLMSKAAYKYREDWKACKDIEMDRLIDLAGRAVPGIRDSIVHAEAATPLTLERYTGNSCGAAFGWEQGPDNSRPGAETGLPGLYLAGHWTYPGGGIESVAASGIIAADKVASGL